MAFPSLTSKVAIITGAGSGIDLAFASLLLSRGCSVLFADLSLRPEAQAVVDAYSAASSQPRAYFQRTDVTSWPALDAMFRVCERELGVPDIVCPGAGWYEPAVSSFWVPPGTAPSIDAADGGRYASFDLLLTHPVRTTQLAIAEFVKHKKQGSVVLISSIAGQSANLSCPLYNAAKHAINGFIRCLKKLETEPDPEGRTPVIRVTGVAPGVIKTPIWTDMPDKLAWVDQVKDVWVSPEEVAGVMLDLVMKEEYVGGTILEVAKDSVRRVEAFNDPGPQGKMGATVSNFGLGETEVWDRLASANWGLQHK